MFFCYSLFYSAGIFQIERIFKKINGCQQLALDGKGGVGVRRFYASCRNHFEHAKFFLEWSINCCPPQVDRLSGPMISCNCADLQRDNRIRHAKYSTIIGLSSYLGPVALSHVLSGCILMLLSMIPADTTCYGPQVILST